MTTVIAVTEVKAFVKKCMTQAGTSVEHAEALAELLVAADYRGHYSHGLNRLEMYVRDVKSGTTVSDGNPLIVKETCATALVDGKNLLGPSIGKFCIDLAIRKAKESGIGMVVASHANHFGIAGWYSMRAMEQGLIGLSFINTSLLVVPTRAKEIAIGTNAVSFSAPGKESDSFVLDMATSAVALGKVEVQRVKGESIPDGWGVDKEGSVTNDPNEVLVDGGLLPLGGTELTSGYKGYGLSMLVEVLCGILAGSAFGPFIRSWKTSSVEANLGQCFMAIDPKAFADGFEDRLQTLMNSYRAMEPTGDQPVLVAGDPERMHMTKCDELGGIPYHKSFVEWMERLAAELSVEKMQAVAV